MTTAPARSVNPTWLVVAGSLLIAWSGIFVRLAELPAATSAFYRCAYAVPPLVLLAWHWRRTGRAEALTARQWGWALLAGICFGADLVLWHVSIGAVGAGLATVLGNLQVVLFPFGAWLVWQEHPTRLQLAVLPVLVVGIVLISGIVGSAAFGDDPVLGAITGALTGVAYAGFLLAMRAGSPDSGGTPVATLTIATAVAAAFALVCALIAGTFDATPPWPAVGWMLLLAWGCQVIAWLLISGSLRRVRAARMSILLLVQPVTALVLGVLVLAEDPSPAQWAGSAIVLGGVLIAGRTGTDDGADAPAPATARAGTGTS